VFSGGRMGSSDDDRGAGLATAATLVADDVRVLVVDDNDSFADLLSSALEATDGIACVGTASSASEGFRAVAELDPSVVVMDIMMPGLDGLAATAELRRLSPRTAVAVVSAHSQGEWIARAEDAGASAYIPKGGSLEEMVAVLRSARPGPMLVAPSLQESWSSWQGRSPEPTPEDRPSSSRWRSAARRPDRDRRRGRSEAGREVQHGALPRLRWHW
jgi:DNA-binding NarL/FixJ family response regulator